MTFYMLEQHSAISSEMNTFLDLAPFWLEKTLRLYQYGLPNIRNTLVQGKMTEYCSNTFATPDIRVLLMCCRRKRSPLNIVWGQWEQHYTRSLGGWCPCLRSDLICLSQVVLESHPSFFGNNSMLVTLAQSSRQGLHLLDSAWASMASVLPEGAGTPKCIQLASAFTSI